MSPPPFVFVLMPFDASFDDVYEVAIKQACRDAGAEAQRVDEQIFKESILQRVYDQIRVADLVVAEMSGRNANVFYEVGYAHAVGKIVILVTRSADDIPFDLKHYPHIIYEGSLTVLRRELCRNVRFWLEHESSVLAKSRVESDASAELKSTHRIRSEHEEAATMTSDAPPDQRHFSLPFHDAVSEQTIPAVDRRGNEPGIPLLPSSTRDPDSLHIVRLALLIMLAALTLLAMLTLSTERYFGLSVGVSVTLAVAAATVLLLSWQRRPATYVVLLLVASVAAPVCVYGGLFVIDVPPSGTIRQFGYMAYVARTVAEIATVIVLLSLAWSGRLREFYGFTYFDRVVSKLIAFGRETD